MAPRLRTVLACELVAAVRALRQRGVVPASAPLRALYDQCLRSPSPPVTRDRPLDEDVAAAERVIAVLAGDADQSPGLAAAQDYAVRVGRLAHGHPSTSNSALVMPLCLPHPLPGSRDSGHGKRGGTAKPRTRSG